MESQLTQSQTAPDKDGNTLLHLAVQVHDYKNIQKNYEKLLLTFQNYPHIDVNAQNKRGETPLHISAEGPERDREYYFERTPSAEENSKKLLQLLIEKGAKLDLRDRWGCTPLHYAVNVSCIVTLEYLISQGARVDIEDCNKNTILHYIGASKKNVVELTRYLCEVNKGSIIRKLINQENALGETPLMMVCRREFTDHPNDKVEVLKLLLEHDANPDIKTDELNTPLHLGAILGDSDLVTLLLNHKNVARYINVQDLDGNTPLHCALQSIENVLSKINNIETCLEDTKQRTRVMLPTTLPSNTLDESPLNIKQRIKSYKNEIKQKKNLLKSYQQIIQSLLNFGADPDIKNYSLLSSRDLSTKLTDPTTQKLLQTTTVIKVKRIQETEEVVRKKLMELLRSDIEFEIVYKDFQSYIDEKDKGYYDSLYEKYSSIYFAIYDSTRQPQKYSKKEIIQELKQAKKLMEESLKLKFSLQDISYRRNITEKERRQSQSQLKVGIINATFAEHIIKRGYDLAKMPYLVDILQSYYLSHRSELHSTVQQEHEKEKEKRQHKLTTSPLESLRTSLSNILQEPSIANTNSNNTSSTQQEDHENTLKWSLK